MLNKYDIIFNDCGNETGRELTTLSGTIPQDLEGSLLRNGPGMFHAGSDPLAFFDGYGFAATVTFRNGRAFYRARFVETPAYLSENTVERMRHRRIFTNLPGRWRNFLDPNFANVTLHDAFYYGGRLFASDDPGYFELDPATLRTKGEFRFDGRAGKAHKMAPVPRVDPARERLITYTVKPNPMGRDTIRFLEFDPSWHAVNEVLHTLGFGLGFTHEVAFTDRWFIVIEAPVRLSLGGALWGARTAFECLEPVPGRAVAAHLVPREPGVGAAVRIELPGGHQAMFHIANAFDDSGAVVIDGPAYAWPGFAYFEPPAIRSRRMGAPRKDPVPVFYRFRIDPATGKAEARELATGVELPRVNPAIHGKPYRYAYLAGAGANGTEPDPFVWAHEVVRVNVEAGTREAWHAGPDRFVSQPVFAPRPNAAAEDDGYVLAWLTDAASGHGQVAILDAKAFAVGPVAVLDAGAFLTLASHCRFEPGLMPG